MKERDRQERRRIIKKYMDNASTRDEAYTRAARRFHTSVAAIKMFASRYHLTSKEHSMQYAFSAKEEEGIVAFCRKYARRSAPLTIPEFIELTSRFKKYPKGRRFTPSFVTKFVRRHKDVLCLRTEKLTSPTRSPSLMEKYTEDFIAELDPLFNKHTINEKNLFVFDETVIGDTSAKQRRVGERRKSGGGNVNVNQKRPKSLGAFLPISQCTGSTPFKVFIRRLGKLGKRASSKRQSEVIEKVISTPTEYKLYLSSRTGYITIPLFKRIMEHFANWWNRDHAGLECYLICDKLPIHVNDDVVASAKAKGIIIKTIMPGSSHWFQVHDQIPFGLLKKKMALKKNTFSKVLSLKPKEMEDFMMGVFATVESEVFVPSNIVKSFADVGLWPWNPSVIRSLCQIHCPSPSRYKTSGIQRKLEKIMNEMIAELKEERGKLITIGKRVRGESSEEEPRYPFRERKGKKSQVCEEGSSQDHSQKKSMSSAMQPSAKRSRKSGFN